MPGKIILAGIILMLLSTAAADMLVVTESTRTTLKNKGLIELGAVQPGETIRLTIASETGRPNIPAEWNMLFILPEFVPTGWKAQDSAQGGKTLTAEIFVPLEAEPGAYEFQAMAQDMNGLLNPEFFTARVFVKKNLVISSIKETSKETAANQAVQFELSLANNSISEHQVVVSSNLPEIWFKSREISLKAGEEKKVSLEVTPRVYGGKDFTFTIRSKVNNSLIDIVSVHLDVQPVLKEKYSIGFYGFPFYTVSLLPYYLINAFISLVFP